MVEVVENWSLIEGEVLSLGAATALAGFEAVDVQVASVASVAGYANLLAGAAGTRLRIHLPGKLAARLRLAPGRRLRCRVRRGGPGQVFAHPQDCDLL